MKKTILFIVTIALAAALTIPAFADEQPEQKALRPGANYADENGDGVCDNRGDRKTVESGKEESRAQGVNYADEDGDGVCDNRDQVCKDGNEGAKQSRYRHCGKNGGQSCGMKGSCRGQ